MGELTIDISIASLEEKKDELIKNYVDFLKDVEGEQPAKDFLKNPTHYRIILPFRESDTDLDESGELNMNLEPRGKNMIEWAYLSTKLDDYTLLALAKLLIDKMTKIKEIFENIKT